MRRLIAVAVLLAIVSAAHAVNVLIWDDDRGDVIPGVGATEVPIRIALQALGHETVVQQSLPVSLDGYDVVFSLHGWYDC